MLETKQNKHLLFHIVCTLKICCNVILGQTMRNVEFFDGPYELLDCCLKSIDDL